MIVEKIVYQDIRIPKIESFIQILQKKITVAMCDQHQPVKWSNYMTYHRTPLSEVCYKACLRCIRAHLDTVLSEDKELEKKRQAFAMECVAWGRGFVEQDDSEQKKDNLADQERCLLFFVNLGWKDTFGYVFEHLGHSLSFSCVIKLCESGTRLDNEVMLMYLKKASSQQIRLLTLCAQNRLGLLWLVGQRIAGRDFADYLVAYL